MKPYLRPRVNGVNKLWMFTEGFGNYLKDVGETGIEMEELPGTEDIRTAELFIRRQIDSGYPVPYLMLRHRKHTTKTLSGTGFCVMDMRSGKTDCGSRSQHMERRIFSCSEICGTQGMRKKAD